MRDHPPRCTVVPILAPDDDPYDAPRENEEHLDRMPFIYSASFLKYLYALVARWANDTITKKA